MTVVSPMILDSSGSVLRRIDPVDVSLDLQLEPLSSAEIELKPGDTIPERSWVSVYTEHGLAGIFRSRPQRDRYGERSSRVSLVHGAVELNDYLTTKGGDQEQDPASTAIAYIMQFYLGTHWRLGTVSATSSVVYQLNGSGVLDAITEIMEQLPGYMLVFDQSVTPWTLNVLPRPETVSAEGRLSRNISSVEISRDDSSLCTRVYYGENDLFVEDAAAIQKYGVIEYRITESGLETSQLAAIAQAYLDNHKESKLSVSISAIDFYNATGEPLDRIALGSKYRLAIPDAETEENRVIEAIICSIRYDSVFSNNPQITLASDPDTIITFLKKQRRSGGSARQLAKEEADKQYQHWTTENNVYKESVYKIMGVKLDEYGNVVYQKDPVTGELILDDAGNPKPVYDPDSGGSLSGVTRETAQNYTRLYELTGVNTLGENETILTRVQQNARQYAIDAVENNMSGYLRIDAFSTELGSALQKDDGTIGAKIATAVDAQKGTSIVTISADKIDLTGYVTASYVDAAKLIAESLASNDGYIGNIKASNINTGGNIVASGAVYGSGLYIGTAAPYASVADAVKTIRKDTTLADGLIGFEFQTLTGTSWTKVNFNIADTAFYKKRVGISSVDPGNWQYDSTEHKYYNPVVATAKDSTQTNPDTMTANVFIPDITLTPVINGLTYVGKVNAWGPSVSGTVYAAADELSLYLKEKDNYVYITKTDSDPVTVGPNSNVVARMEIQGGGSEEDYNQGYADGQTNADAVIDTISHPAGDTAYLSSYLNIDIYANPNLALTDQDGIVSYIEKTGITDTIQIPVVVTPVSLDKGTISTSDDYTGVYTITGDGGNVNVDGQNGTNIPVSTKSLQLSLQLGTPSTDLGTTGSTKWSSDNHNYVYSVRSSLSVDNTGNVLTREVKNITLVPTDAIDYGKSLVSATLKGATTQSTYTTLEPGYYGLYRVVDNVTESTAVNYYRVTSGGTSSVKYVVSSNGEPILVWNGMDIVGGLYPNTDVITGGTDQLNRTQVTYRGRTGYVGGSYISTTKGSTNYIGRIGWTDEGSDASTRAVYSLSDVILNPDDTTRSTHNVDVTYDDGTYVPNGARITIDASAIDGGGGGGGEGGISSASIYAHSDEQSDWTDWTKDGYGNLDEKYGLIKINAKDGTSYYYGINASDVWQNGYTKGRTEVSPYNIEDLRTISITSNGTRTINPSSTQYDAMAAVKVTVNVSTEGGVSGVTKYAESSESSDWNDWVFNSTQSISEKYGNFTITGNDGSTYKFGVNASGLLESNRTITYTTNGKKTLYPSSKVGMEKATITIDVPQSSSSLGTRTITSNGTYSASTYGYDGFSSVTVNVSTSHNITAGTPVARTGSTGSRVYMGSIAASRLAANMWISVPISCGETSKTFYISIT